MNGVSESDMERLKQDIMTDIRKELQKLKLDIIEGQFVNLFPASLNNRVETVYGHIEFLQI